MKQVLKATIFLLVLSAAALPSSVQAQKFGYVNSSALLSEMPEVKRAETELEALQTQLQKKGQGMVEQLQKDYLAVQEKVERGELSPKQQQEEGAKLEAKQKEIGEYEQTMVQQLQEKRNKLLQPIYDNINKAIAEVAKEEGYLFIFDQQVLLYFEAGQDVGPKVRERLKTLMAAAPDNDK